MEEWLEEDLVEGRITPLVAESLLCQQHKKTQVETNKISQDLDFDFVLSLDKVQGSACYRMSQNRVAEFLTVHTDQFLVQILRP